MSTRIARMRSFETKLSSSAGFGGLMMGLVIILVLSIILAAALGTANISPQTAWSVSLHHLGISFGTPDWTVAQDRIVWQIRVPRSLLAILVGASLAVVGATVQAIVRNPLADATILGGTSGATTGAVLVIVAGWSLAGTWSLSIAAFFGALIAFSLTFLLARWSGSLSPIRLILAGIAVGYVLSAVTSLVVFTAENANATRSALFWMLGALGGARWDTLLMLAVPLMIGTFFLIGHARAMDAMLFGEETAASLGVDSERLRRTLFVVVAVLTGISVALAGGIGFVGLVVPHAVRLIVGSGHQRVLPLSAVVGGLFLLWADVLARTVVSPHELPIGVISALVGGPVFAWLLTRSNS